MAESVRPDSIVILGKRHAIEWDAKIGRDCGDIHFTHNKIRIAQELAPDEERETLLHETIHGVDFAVGIGINEAKTRALSATLFAVLATNPALVAYLFGARE